MSTKTIQVIHICDHCVSSTEKKTGRIIVKRENGAVDIIKQYSEVLKIFSIYQLDDDEKVITYYLGKDFSLQKKNQILWDMNSSIPLAGEEYFIDGIFAKSDSTEYEEKECPRCSGSRWYIDLIPETEDKIESVFGINKIIQDILKIIYTQKTDDGYGTDISEYIGKEVYDEVELCSSVYNMISDAGEQYKDIQLSAQIDGIEMADDELLADLIINSVVYSKETESVTATIVIVTQSGEEAEFDIEA